MVEIPRVPVVGEFRLETGDVKLTITIGEGQQGFSLARVEEEEKAEGDVIKSVLLGTTESLKGRRLLIDTTVAVTNGQTSRTSVIYTLEQGSQKKPFVGSKTLGRPGDQVLYEGEITFQEA